MLTTTTDTRDSQKARVYGADQQVRRMFDTARKTGSTLVSVANSDLVLPSEILFGSLDGVRTYLTVVQSSDWYRDCWPTSPPVKVRQRRGNRLAHYSQGTIALHDDQQRGAHWAMRELVVLHELAHHVTPKDPGHGAAFCGAFVYLVNNAMGPVAGFVLMHAFDTNGCHQIQH